MGRVVVVTSGKGGVGKTTMTANLGTLLALEGQRVAVVDADIGLRNLDIVMGLEGQIVRTSMDVVSGNCSLRKALVRDKRSANLYLLAASQKHDKTCMQPEQMAKLCAELKEMCDFVLVDSPAGIEQGFQNSIAGADAAIVVTTPDVAAVRDADRVIGLLQMSHLDSIHLLLNRFDEQKARRGDMLSQEDVAELLCVPLLGVVPDEQEVLIAGNRGTPLALSSDAPAVEVIRMAAKFLIVEEMQKRAVAYKRSLAELVKKEANPDRRRHLRPIKLTADQKALLQDKILGLSA